MKLEVVRHDTRCAVCWGTLKKVKVVSPCLHRFCTKCIEEHLRKLNNHCPTCRVHVPSRRALREDPDFDAVVTALYASAKDYDLRENAYSAHVAKKTMQEDKEERERERAAKKRRMEEAAAQAAVMREQYRLEAEAKRRADEEAAAARAAEEAEERRAAEQRAEAAKAAAEAAAKAAANAPAAPAPTATAKTPKTPKSAAGKTTTDKDKRPPGRPRSSSAADPASNPETKTRGFVAVESPMPDDFAGLYAVRAGDDRARAAAGDLKEDADVRFPVELRRNAMDGGVGLLSRPHVRAPGSAPVSVIKKLVAKDAGVAVSAVRLTANDGAEEDFDPRTTVRDALYAQLQAGEQELTLRYSVV